MVEDEDGLAESHHDLHVVLDEQHGLALVAQAADGVEQVVEQRAVHPRRGLVEQDQRRIAHEHAHELHELLLPVREVARVLVGEALELDEGEQVAGPRARGRVWSPRDDEQVLQRGQLGEHPDDLERAAHAAPGDLPGLEPLHPRAVEDHLPGVEALHARDAVVQRGLARAVGADEPIDPPALERERHAVEGADAPEVLVDVHDLERGAGAQIVLGSRYFVCKSPSTPRGIASTTATMMAPNSSGWT